MSARRPREQHDAGRVGDAIRDVDRDGAIAETMAAALPRSQFLKRALLGAGALATGLGAPAALLAADSANDAAILNFLLTLERLQAAFYGETERIGAVGGRELDTARTIAAAERAHVVALRDRLGTRAIAAPTFDFQGTTEERASFLRTAVAFEDLAVASFAGAVPDLEDGALRALVVTIHTPEARHASRLRTRAGLDPAPNALEPTTTRAAALREINGTGFVVSKPLTTRSVPPSFTG
jgi:hypothetical protein